MNAIASHLRLSVFLALLSVAPSGFAADAMQVLVGDARPGCPFMRAMHIGGNWGLSRDNVGDGTQLPEEYFRFLDSLQVNWVGISQALHISDSMDNNPRLATSGFPINSFSDEVLSNLIRTFRRHGYNVYVTLAIEDQDALIAAKPVGRSQLGNPNGRG